eukprot:676038-Prorocentrum_minimum.AAC.4
MVSAVKWVDEVIPNTPYEITEEFMTELFEKHKIDFIVHGDDPCLLPVSTDHVQRSNRRDGSSKATFGRTYSTNPSLISPPTSRLSEALCLGDPNPRVPAGRIGCLRGFGAFCDGSDAYAAAKRVGRFVTIKRTEGISTTDLVGRMLMCVRGEATKDSTQKASQLKEFSSNPSISTNPDEGLERTTSDTRVSQFLPTSRRFVQFSSGKQPFPGATIVYVDGAFDMFHSGEHGSMPRSATRRHPGPTPHPPPFVSAREFLERANELTDPLKNLLDPLKNLQPPAAPYHRAHGILGEGVGARTPPVRPKTPLQAPPCSPPKTPLEAPPCSPRHRRAHEPFGEREGGQAPPQTPPGPPQTPLKAPPEPLRHPPPALDRIALQVT